MNNSSSLLVMLFRQFPRGHLLATLLLAVVVGTALMTPEAGNSIPSQATLDLDLPLPAERFEAPLPEMAEQEKYNWQDIKVKSGDTLAKLLRNQGVSAADIHQLVTSSDDAKSLANIRPGDTLRFAMGDGGQLVALQQQLSRIETVTAERTDDTWQLTRIARDYDRQVTYAEAIIDDSLFLAGQQAGMTDNLIMQLANIFGWDIDFVMDIRKGDHFRLLYEELFLDGEKVGDGNILMAEFWNQGRHVTAFRYETKSGDTDYLDLKGDSLRKEFIRSPVSFTRISSRFSTGRYHPVLHKVRAHKGIDYAAPRGTPVKAAGDGKVIHAGNKGGYGRTVIVQHGQSYTTLYAHLNGYAKGIRTGKRVRQGDVIGYVGSSGLATGPHLHYEFRLNGVHRNPLTVPLPKARGIPDNERKEFLVHANKLRNQLALHAEAFTLARNDQQ
ncbi:MAG: peptidoglycan DD-metalloendopeptidase family protein [Alcanivoracaceae bacterium]|nr:peptidoglycan DD-metalloendopeptidase family protein [Alcanivoracaceae bacterium]